MEVYKKEKRKVKRCIYQSKGVRGQFGRKINQDVNGNRKLFWKEVSKVNGGKVENSNSIKDGNGSLVLEEAEVPRIWKVYYSNRLQSTCVALMEFGETTTSEESRREEVTG